MQYEHGSEAFYSTVAVVLPVFGFLVLYQRSRGWFTFFDHLEFTKRAQPEEWSRRRLAFGFAGGMAMFATFAYLIIGEVVCLHQLAGGGGHLDTYVIVWVCVGTQVAVLTLAEFLNVGVLALEWMRANIGRPEDDSYGPIGCGNQEQSAPPSHEALEDSAACGTTNTRPHSSGS